MGTLHAALLGGGEQGVVAHDVVFAYAISWAKVGIPSLFHATVS